MGCRIFIGHETGCEGANQEIFYDSVTGWAFGPIMESGQGDMFEKWLSEKGHGDPRAVPSRMLEDLWGQFLDNQNAEREPVLPKDSGLRGTDPKQY